MARYALFALFWIYGNGDSTDSEFGLANMYPNSQSGLSKMYPDSDSGSNKMNPEELIEKNQVSPETEGAAQNQDDQQLPSSSGSEGPCLECSEHVQEPVKTRTEFVVPRDRVESEIPKQVLSVIEKHVDELLSSSSRSLRGSIRRTLGDRANSLDDHVDRKTEREKRRKKYLSKLGV